MTVTMERFGDEERVKFMVSTNLARAEAILLPAQKTFVERFVRQAMTANRPDCGTGAPGRTPFELLLPDSLKEQAQEDRNLRLILDPACAAYPWSRGGIMARRVNRGYSLFSARTGAPVARLRPLAGSRGVEVLW